MNFVKTGRWIFVDITLLYVPPVYYVYYGQLCWIKLSESESESHFLYCTILDGSNDTLGILSYCVLNLCVCLYDT